MCVNKWFQLFQKDSWESMEAAAIRSRRKSFKKERIDESGNPEDESLNKVIVSETNFPNSDEKHSISDASSSDRNNFGEKGEKLSNEKKRLTPKRIDESGNPEDESLSKVIVSETNVPNSDELSNDGLHAQTTDSNHKSSPQSAPPDPLDSLRPIRITFLSRQTKYRRIVNEEELFAAIR